MSNEFRYFVTALNEYNNNDKQKNSHILLKNLLR